MPFSNNENIIQLNKELWIIPILILVVLLYVSKKIEHRRMFQMLSILYATFLIYNLYYLFRPLFTIEGTLYYFVEYPYGFVFLALSLFLIFNIIFPNKLSSYIALILALIIVFNQAYLRIQTGKLNIEYERIIENKGNGNILTVDIDTTDNCYSNLFPDDTFFRHYFRVNKTISFTPYCSLKEEHFINFKFPNYYWTKYNAYDKRSVIAPIEGDFVRPEIIEEFKLKTRTKIKEYYVLYRIDRKGKLRDTIHTFPDSINIINRQEYIKSTRFIPAYLNGKAVETIYYKKYLP